MKANIVGISLLAAFFLFSGNACKNEPNTVKPLPTVCDSANTVRIPKDVVEKFYFKDSTYWIYQDSVTQAIDSVWVFGSKYETYNEFHNKKLYKKCYESYMYVFNSSLYGKTNVVIEPNSVDDERKYDAEYFEVTYFIGHINYSPVFRFFLRGNQYLSNQSGSILNLIQNFKVQGNSYHNVLHLSNLDGNLDIYKEAYYASHIGLVKYQLKNGSVWELIRYKIK